LLSTQTLLAFSLLGVLSLLLVWLKYRTND